MDLQAICHKVTALSAETRLFILQEAGRIKAESIEVKDRNSFVTYVDKGSEERLVKGLSALLPEAGFITEENTISKKGEHYEWVIDPLDGTTNFIHGIPCYAISIGLLRDQVPVLGVVHELNMDECFYAWEGGPACMNQKEVKVSGAAKLADTLIATGFPYYDYERQEEYMELFRHFMRTTRGLRRLGSAAADLAYVACGRFDGFYEYSLHPWDVTAGAFIVQQAGGKVSDFSGKDNYIFGKEIVAANSAVYNEFLAAVKQYFK